MRWLCFAFALGVMALQCFVRLPPLWWIVAAVVVTAPLAWLLRSRLPAGCWVVKVLLAGLLGLLWAVIYTQHVLAWSLPLALQKHTLPATGTIMTAPLQNSHHLSFVVRLQQLNHRPNHANIKLNWYRFQSVPKVGEHWQFNVRLKRPHKLADPGAFDVTKSMLQHHVRARGYVISARKVRSAQHIGVSAAVMRLRNDVARHINNDLRTHALAGLIVALTVGITKGISQQQWMVFRQSGTSHLMAISGLHIGLVAGLIFMLVNVSWRRVTPLALWCPAQQAAAAAALCAAFLYSVLAGFGIPAQRALVMIFIATLAVMLRRRLLPWHTIVLALFIVLLMDPLAPLRAGFWLSFAAVSTIIYGISGRLSPPRLFWKIVRVQWVVMLGLMPLSLLFFQQTSLVALLANSVAIPWVSFIVVPLSLIGALLIMGHINGAGFVLLMALHAMQWLWLLLQWLTHFPMAVWHHALLNDWVLMASIVGVSLLLAPRGWPGRYCGIVALLPVLFATPARPPRHAVWLTLLDVGQGLALVVQTQHHVLVYDTGAKLSPNYDMGRAVVVPFLRTRFIDHIDTMIISHRDNDHSGGATAILAALPVHHLLTSVPQRFARYHAAPCLAGQHWQWDGVEFTMLYPPPSLLGLDNNSSCVLKISTQHRSILLTGDIEKLAEHYLLHHNTQQLSATVLVAPHHGSRTSGLVHFINAVSPRFVLYSTGYLNRYHFPNHTVVKHYQRIGALGFNTAHGGAITLKLTPKGATISTFQAQHRRFWD